MAKTIYWHEYWPKKKGKNGFEIFFFKLMNNVAFEKTMENERKHRDNKFIAKDRR